MNENKGVLLEAQPASEEVNGHKSVTPKAKDSSAITTAMKVMVGLLLLVGLALAGLFAVGYMQQQQQAAQSKADQALQEKQQANNDLQKQLEDIQKQQAQQQASQAAQQQPQVVVENNGTNAPSAAAPEGVVVTAPNYSSTGSEAADVLTAAENYYQAAELGDYTYTYEHLSTPDQDYYTYDQWVYANNALDSAAGEFVIYDVSPGSDPNFYDVSLTVYLADGSSYDRTTEFTYESGRGWVHWLTGEEYDMFDSVL